MSRIFVAYRSEVTPPVVLTGENSVKRGMYELPGDCLII